MENDSQFNFRGQRSNEQVVLVIKQHPWLFLPAVIFWLIIGLLLTVSFWQFGASKISSTVLVVGTILGLLYTVYRWFLWGNGINIITNQRVVKVDQRGLFNRQISEAEIDRIQEISTEITGPIKTMLNFGTVKIQTASSTGRVDLTNVPDPYDIQQAIVQLQRHEARQPNPQRRV